jgi:sugar phosphate isomerase/epimerase
MGQSTHTSKQEMNRRTLLAGAAATAVLAAKAGSAASHMVPKYPSVNIFTKHLAWLEYDALADTMAELGFDGADLTMRPKGHVLPENVERDLPKAVEAIEKVGLKVNMMTTPVSDPADPETERILKTASALKIPFYRIGAWRYDLKKDIMQQLSEHNARLKDLAAMNKHYNIRAGYHNHSGRGDIGGPVWDVLKMLEGVDTEWVGSNYDPGHCFAEGSNGAWLTNFKVIAPYIKMSAIKDFAWVQTKDGWRNEFPPVGQGMINWKETFGLYKEINFTGPLSVHIEYDIEGEGEEKHINELKAIKRDLGVLVGLLKETGLRA